MSLDQVLSGLLSSTAIAVLIKTMVDWGRNKKKDNATARKTNADAFAQETSTMSEGFESLISSMRMITEEQRKLFQSMLDDERRDCDLKMGQMQLSHSIEMDFLKKEIDKLKQNNIK